MTFSLLTCTPFWKEVYSKSLEFVPKWGKLFPFSVNSFSEMSTNHFEFFSLESASTALNIYNSLG